MKYLYIPSLLIVLLSSAFVMQVQEFSATYQGVDIRLDWQVKADAEIQAFQVYRKKGEDGSYKLIRTLDHNGQRSYFMIDDELYKGNETQETISYRLEAQTPEGSSTHYAQIEHNPTAVQRSWGSIKAMFK